MVVTVEILASLAEVVELLDINKNSQRTNKERNTKTKNICLSSPSVLLSAGRPYFLIDASHPHSATQSVS